MSSTFRSLASAAVATQPALSACQAPYSLQTQLQGTLAIRARAFPSTALARAGCISFLLLL